MQQANLNALADAALAAALGAQTGEEIVVTARLDSAFDSSLRFSLLYSESSAKDAKFFPWMQESGSTSG